MSSFREKVPVLCKYRVYKRFGKSTVKEEGYIQVQAEFSDQVKDLFEAAMERRKLEYPDWNNVVDYDLTGYIPANGKENW